MNSPASPVAATAEICEHLTSAGQVISKIEAIMERIVYSLKIKEQLTINLATPQRYGRNRGKISQEEICYPGTCLKEAKKFARVLLILQLSHDALVSNEILTKRHIYYQHQELFEKQKRVDELVDCIALTLGVEREDLNIVATSKGVMAGPITIKLTDGTVLDGRKGDSGVSIPVTKTILSVDTRAIKWVLVLEKDAVFRSLSSSRFWQTSLHGPGLIVTAKGYPDVLTCSFLRLLNLRNPDLPLLALVDWDPDGLNIFKCYRYISGPTSGSSFTNHSLFWLGIKASQILEFETRTCATSETTTGSELSQDDWLVRGKSNGTPVSSTTCRGPASHLSTRDRRLAAKTMERLEPMAEVDVQAAELKMELQRMLMLGVKTEIQWVDDNGRIVEWLDDAIGEMLRV